MQPQTILDVIAHDHIEDLRRQARRARLAAKARSGQPGGAAALRC